MLNGDSTSAPDAFYQLAAISLVDETMSSVMEKVAAISKQTLPGASEVSVSLAERGKVGTVAYTGQLAMDLDERQYEQGDGPCLTCVRSGETIHVPDMQKEIRWPEWTQSATRHGAASSLSIPVPVKGEVSAALNIYSTEVDAFDERALDTGRAFAAYAGVALANMHLYEARGEVAEQLQAAMQSRAVIEQAKGILMGARRCTPDEAFAILADLSQRSNRKLRDVAAALVDEASPAAAQVAAQDGA